MLDTSLLADRIKNQAAILMFCRNLCGYGLATEGKEGIFVQSSLHKCCSDLRAAQHLLGQFRQNLISLGQQRRMAGDRRAE